MPDETRALNRQSPTYLTLLINCYKPPRSLRSSDRLVLQVPTVTTASYGQRTFSSCAPKPWKTRPQSIKHSEKQVDGQLRNTSISFSERLPQMFVAWPHLGFKVVFRTCTINLYLPNYSSVVSTHLEFSRSTVSRFPEIGFPTRPQTFSFRSSCGFHGPTTFQKFI